MTVYVVSSGQDRVLVEQGTYWLPQWYRGTRHALDAGALDAHAIYASQSAVRTVVDFVARAVASVPLHVYRRVSDSDRQRVTDHPLAATLDAPVPYLTQSRWVEALLSDLLLYDRWAALKTFGPDGRTLQLWRIPPDRFYVEANVLGQVIGLRVFDGRRFDPAVFLFDRGYSAVGANGTPPMESIRALLVELQEGASYREQLWRSGARVPQVIERPPEAPQWSKTARERFGQQWNEWYAGDGARAGGTPILEDGMKLAKAEGFTAEDSQWLEGRQLTLAEVASAFHVPPELVGARAGNYSNVREFRQALYRDALGPLLTSFGQTLNALLVPEFGEPDLYVEPFIEAKLRGSFEEQADYLQRAVGGPYMTRDEARARLNLPKIDGADELIVPLNVLVGGQASPADSVPTDRTIGQAARPDAGNNVPGIRAKAAPSQALARRLTVARSALARQLAEFFDRQGRSVISALGAKAIPPLADAWNSDRWDGELARILTGAALTAGTLAALDVLDHHDGPDYDPARIEPYLATASANNAAAMNAATYSALAAAITSPDWRSAARDVFDAAAAVRAVQAAGTVTTEAAGFARVDAAAGRGLTVKTWHLEPGVKDPRPSHAALNGASVPLHGRFSNGGRWPGDRSLSADERAGCTCTVGFSHEEGPV